ncbi:RNA-directed DNA polymerase from retron Mx65, putative [Stigmatella aurantiaca DW4/3-1]|uniref:RNA-directed DNA polymerase from retron Mx65, putative n=1 Tax=Stigmatella aurantiaca (strain DW4/3-1) TaxID=378806 RepID=Q09AG5_STIAD|nr:RNA-directed DNA polymerase from retron Mx65, putative [Stigmatella aurantiaca DW4/3-1]
MTSMAFPFRSIRHSSDLAQALECTADDLNTFADTSRQREFYNELRIPKRRRQGYRIVYRAKAAVLLRMHKTLADAVSGAVSFPTYVQGFVKKRSIVTNARQHLGKPLLLHADIKHFFESITRYADDITLSGDEVPSEELLRAFNSASPGPVTQCGGTRPPISGKRSYARKSASRCEGLSRSSGVSVSRTIHPSLPVRRARARSSASRAGSGNPRVCAVVADQ